MPAWTEAVKTPSGFVFLVLLLLCGGLTWWRSKPPWLVRMRAACLALTLLCGLYIYYLETSKPTRLPASSQAPSAQTNAVTQSTSGPGSPTIQGVQGDVTVTVDQSTDKTTVNHGDGKTIKSTHKKQSGGKSN